MSHVTIVIYVRYLISTHIGQNQRRPPVPKGPCWFCLGSPEVDKHLIVSVGEQVGTSSEIHNGNYTHVTVCGQKVTIVS